MLWKMAFLYSKVNSNCSLYQNLQLFQYRAFHYINRTIIGLISFNSNLLIFYFHCNLLYNQKHIIQEYDILRLEQQIIFFWVFRTDYQIILTVSPCYFLSVYQKVCPSLSDRTSRLYKRRDEIRTAANLFSGG